MRSLPNSSLLFSEDKEASEPTGASDDVTVDQDFAVLLVSLLEALENAQGLSLGTFVHDWLLFNTRRWLFGRRRLSVGFTVRREVLSENLSILSEQSR